MQVNSNFYPENKLNIAFFLYFVFILITILKEITVQRNSVATLLLLLGTFFWGMTFVFVKEGIAIVDLYTFLAWRFAIASLLLIIIFKKQFNVFNKKLICYGILLGIVLAISYFTQTIGLKYTTASKAAFITGLSVIFVPLFLAIIERRIPQINHIIAAIIATLGVGLLTASASLYFNTGDIWVFFCAVSFALYIILVGRYTKMFESIKFTTVQLLTVSITSGIISIGSGKMEIPKGYIVWQAILICAVFATAYMYVIQNQFQKYISEVKAVIIFSFEPLFAAITAYFYLNEEITLRIISGGLLIFTGMIVSELKYENLLNHAIRIRDRII